MYFLWCIDRLTDVVDDPDRLTDPRQLAVHEIDEPRIRTALQSYTRQNDSRSVMEVVRDIAGAIVAGADIRRIGACEPPTMFRSSDGANMISEGNHRAAALYLSGIEPFELELVVVDFAPFAFYERPGLRDYHPSSRPPPGSVG